MVSYLIMPGVGFLLTIWLWTSLPGNALLIGVIWMLIGLVYLAFLTKGFRAAPPSLNDDSAEALVTQSIETVEPSESERA